MEINIIELKNAMYSKIIEKRDISKINKIISKIENKKINKDNFWNEIKKLTQRVYSDHSLSRWQCLAEYAYKLI